MDFIAIEIVYVCRIFSNYNFFVTHRLMRNGWSYQPRSYDDSITYKHKIQIKIMLKIINDLKENSYTYRIF